MNKKENLKREIAYKKIIENYKQSIEYFKEIKDDIPEEIFNSQVEMRQEILKYLENPFSKSLCEWEENPLLNKLRKITQMLRQKHIKSPLQQSC